MITILPGLLPNKKEITRFTHHHIFKTLLFFQGKLRGAASEIRG